MTVIVYSIGKKLLPAAEYPISSVTAPNAKRLIEPAFAFKNDDKDLKYFLRLFSARSCNVLFPAVISPISFFWSFTSAKRTK